MQRLLYDYNEYGERVGMRTFQTTPEGDPGHHEDAGAKTAWHYHEATGSLLRKEYADGKGPEYAYNEAGQLKERRWAREDKGSAGTPARNDGRLATVYEYDSATLQLAKSTATDDTEVQYEYDPEGRLAKVADATGTREFAYDLRGQVVKETVILQPNPGGDPAAADPIKYTIHRAHTPLGQPESVHLVSADGETLALDHKIDYAWNLHGQLASVKSLAGEFVYGYDEKNPALLTKMTGPVHEVETTYEPHRNLITGVVNRGMGFLSGPPSAMDRAGTSDPRPAAPSLPDARANAPTPAPAADSEPSTKNQEPRTLSSYLYANDLLGRRKTISQGGEAFAMLKLGENKIEVAYNDRSEVVGAKYQSRSGVPPLEYAYDYDGIGNRRGFQSTVNGEQSTVAYRSNALNQYTEVKTNSVNSVNSVGKPTHDLDGNLLEDGRNTYTWNADNNLVRVESKDGSLRLDYLYDYQSRRTVRTERKNPGKANESRRTTFYHYDDWNVVAEVSAVTGHESGVTGEPADSVRYYTWGRDLSGSLQGAGGVGGLLAISEGGSRRFPVYDANGNVGQLLDEHGQTVAAYAYDPFGNVTEMAGAEAEANPWRFSTKPVDSGAGWLYYGYRWYDAEAGRWVSRDPIEESGGMNLYGFVRNGVVNKWDFLGFSEQGQELIQRLKEIGDELESLNRELKSEIDKLDKGLRELWDQQLKEGCCDTEKKKTIKTTQKTALSNLQDQVREARKQLQMMSAFNRAWGFLGIVGASRVSPQINAADVNAWLTVLYGVGCVRLSAAYFECKRQELEASVYESPDYFQLCETCDVLERWKNQICGIAAGGN